MVPFKDSLTFLNEVNDPLSLGERDPLLLTENDDNWIDIEDEFISNPAVNSKKTYSKQKNTLAKLKKIRKFIPDYLKHDIEDITTNVQDFSRLW